MNRHWDKTILPLLIKIKPKHIVEIGSDKGRNTRNILKYCEENNAKLTSIDPKPNFDVDKLKKQYGEKFDLYQDLSLRTLPFLDDFDVILIDGDHNWYTVYNELKTIEKISKKSNKYPLILFHDICWPYGRRDLYYNPETIPEEYVLPYDEKGMIPNQKVLSADKGLNDHGLKNALYEGGKQNGVLTAIEDYIAESPLDLMFYSIPAYYGLGILFLKNRKLQKIVESTIDYPQIMEELEKYYLTIIHSNLKAEMNKLNKIIDKTNADLKKINEEKNTLEEKNKEKYTKIQKLNENNKEKDNQIKTLNEEITYINKTKELEINELKKENAIELEELKEKSSVISSMKEEINNIKANIIEKENQNKMLLEENNIIKMTIDEKNNQIKVLEEKIELLNSIIKEKDKLLNSS